MAELDVRIAAFAWLKERGAANGDVFPCTLLNHGFPYEGRRITLKGAAGIWFPQGFSVPVSITAALNGPYRLDDIGDDGLLTYAYRGKDPDHRDNQRLHQGAFRDMDISAYGQPLGVPRPRERRSVRAAWSQAPSGGVRAAGVPSSLRAPPRAHAEVTLLPHTRHQPRQARRSRSAPPRRAVPNSATLAPRRPRAARVPGFRARLQVRSARNYGLVAFFIDMSDPLIYTWIEFPTAKAQPIWLRSDPHWISPRASGGVFFIQEESMPNEPSVKRAVAFFDGQNLFYAAKDAFGYSFPNYDPKVLTDRICKSKGWSVAGVYFYTGIPSAADKPLWNQFWTKKLMIMGSRGVHTFSRPLRYRNKTIHLDRAAISVPGAAPLTLPAGASTVALVGQEKGVDIRIALDIVRMALDNLYDVALIFSQDQDLTEAVKDVRKISALQDQWIGVASAFPVSPTVPKTRGINGTDWIRIDRTLYDSCLDPIDYRFTS